MNGTKGINRKRMAGAAITEYLPIVGLILTLALGAVAQYAKEARIHAGQISEELAGIGHTATGIVNNNPMPSNSGNGGSGGGTNTGGNTNGGGSTNTGGSTNGGGGTNTGGSTNGGGNTIIGGGTTGGSNTIGNNLVGGGNSNSGGSTSNTNGGTSSQQPPEDNSALLNGVGRFITGLWDGVKEQFTGLIQMALHPIDTALAMKDLAVAFVTSPAETLRVIKEELANQFKQIATLDPYTIGKVVGENVSPATLLNLVNKLKNISSIAVKMAAAGKKIDTACSSFLAGTLVWSDKGLTAIETLKVGDTVYARSDENFQDSPRKIQQLLGRHVEHYYILETGKEPISVTEEHPFYLQGKGWTPASQLKVGDALASADGDVLVTSIKRVQGHAQVYNFSVEVIHSYFVGSNKLWVHNANSACSIGSGVAQAALKRIDQIIPPNTPARAKFDVDWAANPLLRKELEADPDLARSWMIAENHPQMRVDPNILKSLKSVANDPATMNAIGGEAGLQELLAAQRSGPSITSTTRTLENLQVVVANHAGVPGLETLIRDLKKANPNAQKGATHTLEVIRNYKKGAIKKMDMEFEDQGATCGHCSFDLELDPALTGGLKFQEFKNWQTNYIGPNTSPPSKGVSVKQLATYLSKADKITDIKYTFNKTSAPDLGEIKKQMQKVFTANADTIFKSMNTNLRNSLRIGNDPVKLKALIDNIDSPLYNFIETK